ncbi:ubiquitin-conjugating enzyme E2 variant [Aeromonas veronii]|uniref:ubiquitin-conjugating enzyme E2 variant n=1 Tax=Aeromonas veronii TaxID=654 RepID=UPI001F396CC8|nr:hypothetical protein [Aeromonas veronii]MCF5888255.1 hypothetical protein [Aeromonas veronii]
MQIIGLEDFLKENPLMNILPTSKSRAIDLSGKVKLNHQFKHFPQVNRLIEIKVTIPDGYPFVPPVFEEVGGFVPRRDAFHVNPDGSLCLGTPLRIEAFIRKELNFNTFYKEFFIPYIYAVSLKILNNIDFVFGELKHGNAGELEDLGDIFGLPNKSQIFGCLDALSMKKRLANKKICPCECGMRLGACRFHYKVNQQRNLLPRRWFRNLKSRLS